MTLGFIIHNRSQEHIICGITNNTNPSASNAWYELHPGASTGIWPRMGWEDVVFKSKDGSKQKSLWANRGSPALVYFNGFDKDLTIQNEYRPEPGFTVTNHTERPIYASVTTNSGGSSNWFLIRPGAQESWKRVGWETVAIKNENDSDRKGIYINNQGARATIGFRGLTQDFEISYTSNDNFIRDEHYTEAVRIADRSFAAQNTRASSPGGLLASVEKINVLETMTTGLTIPFSFSPSKSDNEFKATISTSGSTIKSTPSLSSSTTSNTDWWIQPSWLPSPANGSKSPPLPASSTRSSSSGSLHQPSTKSHPEGSVPPWAHVSSPFPNFPTNLKVSKACRQTSLQVPDHAVRSKWFSYPRLFFLISFLQMFGTISILWSRRTW
jgi:hypothetical protein